MESALFTKPLHDRALMLVAEGRVICTTTVGYVGLDLKAIGEVR